MASIPPDYFRTAAEKYAENPTNRKYWLKEQISLADQSILGYQVELVEMYKLAEKYGAVFDQSGNVSLQQIKGEAASLATIGTVLAAIPTGYTQIVGGIFVFASTFFQKAENKRNSKQVQEILTVAIARTEEVKKVGEYRTKYQRELIYLNIIPVVLTAIFIFLILK